MKLSNAFSILVDMIYAVRVAFLPTVREIIRTPGLLLHPIQVSRLFMSFVWVFFGDVVNENSKAVKSALITPNAYGVILDIGAGHGHTIGYLDKTKVTKYVAIEPNTHMHDEIRKTAHFAGYTEDAGNLLILSYGAEQTALISSALGGPQAVDTLISILTLCSVPNPETAIPALMDQVVKPGGTMLYYEHVRHRRDDVFWWQRFWTPIWKMAFDGCSLTVPTDVIIDELDVWRQKEVKGVDGENEESLFIHKIGRLTKA